MQVNIMIKYFMLSILFCAQLFAEEIKLVPQKDIELPSGLKKTIQQFWVSVHSADYKKASEYSALSYDFEDNHLLIRTHFDKSEDIEWKPRYYSKVLRENISGKYLLNIEFMKDSKSLEKNSNCYLIEALENQKYRIIGLISDCFEG